MFFLPLIVVILLVVYLASIYNKFVTTKRRINVSIQEIGNQLKRQAQLIPQLVSKTERHLKHEEKLFGEITEARKSIAEALKSGSAQEMVDVSEKIQSLIPTVKVVLESTPAITAAPVTMKLMDELVDTADKLMYARRTLIDLSGDYNIMLSQVPSSWVGKMFGFKEEVGLRTPEEGSHLEVSKEELKTPEV